MARRLRCIPESETLVEVTCRTIQGRLLLKPSSELHEIVIGVLARAQRLYPVEVCGLVFLSNHFHLLLVVPDADRLARFMCFLNSNLAREAGRLARWRDRFWARRYQSILVSGEESAQAGRLRYLISHGCKEGLVARPQDWPGVHGVDALLTGGSLSGYWFDRTQEYAARSRGESVARLQFAAAESLMLSTLPCWRHLPPDEIRRRVAELVKEVEIEAAAERKNRRPLGVGAILRQHPHHAPTRPKRSPAPSFHASTSAVRRQLKDAYRRFVAAFREAAERLRSGDRSASFPVGSFPPSLPFVERGSAPP